MYETPIWDVVNECFNKEINRWSNGRFGVFDNVLFNILTRVFLLYYQNCMIGAHFSANRDQVGVT